MVNVGEVERLMRARDHFSASTAPADRERIMRGLADEVPGLLAELKEKILQLSEEKERHQRIVEAAIKKDEALVVANRLISDIKARLSKESCGCALVVESILTPTEKRIHEHEWAAMPLKKIKCYKCGEVRDSI